MPQNHNPLPVARSASSKPKINSSNYAKPGEEIELIFDGGFNAKDTNGTTAVGRHPPKFREPSNKRILTRAKCNYAKPGEEIELIFEDGGFNATKSQALPVASSKPKINSSTCCARPGPKVGTLMRPETNLTISRRVSSPKCRATAISQKAISTGRCLAYSIKNALR